MANKTTFEGSVRVDLVGGTLDLFPINTLLDKVVTLNCATSLKAKVTIESADIFKITSLDYNTSEECATSELSQKHLEDSPFQFVWKILFHFYENFPVTLAGLKIELSSGSPAGAGLGGSSAMGVTLLTALQKHHHLTSDNRFANIFMTQAIEAQILNQGVPGYQDYFPALFGGVLALTPDLGSFHHHDNAGYGVKLKQLYSPQLKDFLESHISLFYSGVSRNSGINNWQVYKDFFDYHCERHALEAIATHSANAYQALKEKNYDELLHNIALEGESRSQLAVSIVPSEIKEVLAHWKELLGETFIGHKMCGAGGGGCFLLLHRPQDSIKTLIDEKTRQILPGIKKLDFYLEPPLQ